MILQRILIVEDSATMRSLLVLSLEGRGSGAPPQDRRGGKRVRNPTLPASRRFQPRRHRSQHSGYRRPRVGVLHREQREIRFDSPGHRFDAQAGEQGKAFSVAADEIKELVSRVLASTKEIGGLISAVQEESENAIGAIEAGSASVMGGIDLTAEAGRTLEEITEASRESGTRISEIVKSVREQTDACSRVTGFLAAWPSRAARMKAPSRVRALRSPS
ncbi:MAG: hypothetical protein CL933_20115 [Deltaproteobacteria bacterium]|nr:hypothetical protein [Deltaproteobacteria bacterium]